MKKITVLIAIMIVLAFMICNFTMAGDGPAPNSGDGISDGSGFNKGRDMDDKGAPNSGDGISDGSGWTDRGGTLDDKGAPNSGDGIPDGSGW